MAVDQHSLLAVLLSGIIMLPSSTCSAVQNADPKKPVAESPDDTPTAAIRSFYQALSRGDGKLAGEFLSAPKEMAEWTAIQVKTSVAFRQLGSAAVVKFGEEGKPLVLPVPAETALKKLDTVEPIQKGDTATWPVNPNAPMKLKKVDGHWKLDIYSSFADPAQLRQLNRVHGRVADYVAKVAADIEEGKLNSVAEVREELKRQREAMNRDFAKE